ncbi:MAG: SRPBCC domain-containing protein [Actinomycetota bacterium]
MDFPELYSVERVFPHPIQVAWDAWTNSDALQSWYHPTELPSVPGSASSDARVGGKWSIGIDASKFGFVPYFYGSYTSVEPLVQLVHTMHYTESPEEFELADATTESHEVVIDFAEVPSGTSIRFTQFGTLPEGEAERAQAGMESYFDSLGIYLTNVGEQG